jgi:hypothetical protein
MRKTFPFAQNKTDNNDTILELNEYIITKDNTPIGIYIVKLKDNVLVRSISYEMKLTSKNFKIDNLSFSSIDDLYIFIKDLLEEKKVTIKEISDKKMKVILDINNKKFEISLQKSKETNSSVINEIFNKYSTLEENINTFNRRSQRLKENVKFNENNKQANSDIGKTKNETPNKKTQSEKNEDKINDIIDNDSDKTDTINNVKKGGTKKLITSLNEQSSLSKSQRLKSKKNIDESPNKKEKSPKDNNKKKEKSEEINTKDQKNMEQFDEEQLFRTQEDRIIFRNGIGNGIIKKYAEIKKVVQHIELKLKSKVRFYMIYKASELGDRAKTFHEKCDNYEMTLVIIETKEGLRFGGFTTELWDGNCIHKRDQKAFVFSLDKDKTYDIVGHDPAIGCYPKYGPIFFGSQIRIYDFFFTKNSITCEKGLCFQTTEDYELNNGKKSFIVKDIEVYALEKVESK